MYSLGGSDTGEKHTKLQVSSSLFIHHSGRTFTMHFSCTRQTLSSTQQKRSKADQCPPLPPPQSLKTMAQLTSHQETDGSAP